MSKTIEFVEKEIEFLKEQIVKYENHLLGFPQVNVENRLEEMKKELQTLEQIKCELEAWEELTTLFYITIDNFGNLYISLGEETVNTLHERVFEKYIDSFKKALEVQNANM